MSFENRVVIITGAGSGIGAAIAIKFAKLSAKLSLIDKNEQTLKEIAQKCKDISSTEHFTLTADLSKLEDIEKVIPETVKAYNQIDVLINNAGIPERKDEDFASNIEDTIRVNLTAPMVLIKNSTPHLIETKGCIINVSSFRSSRPSVACQIYCVTKAGLEMFTKCTALDLADRGVRCNSIHPGPCRSNFTSVRDSKADMEKRFEDLDGKLPFGMLEGGDVANLVVFLSDSELARKITGGSFNIDGGVSLMETKTLGGKY